MHKITTSVLCAALIGCGFSDFNPDLSSLEGSETSETEGTEATESTETDTISTSSEATDSSSETDTGSTGDGDGDGDSTETSGDGDGDGDTGTEELGFGDECHPFAAQLGLSDCSDFANCQLQGWDQENDHWSWTCELAEGMGEWLDECPPSTNACASGFTPSAAFNEGDCAFPGCCTALCDPLNPICEEGYQCDPMSTTSADYPPFFGETEMPYIGTCWPIG